MTTPPVPPSRLPYGQPELYAGVVDSGFEQRLIEGIRPIAEHFLASALHHLFDSGIFDTLQAEQGYRPIAGLADQLVSEEYRLLGLLQFLANEGVVEIEADAVRLTAKGLGYGEFRAWYTMMVGGYSSTLGQLGDALHKGSPACGRNGRHVSRGSCEMSRYDGIPITRELMARGAVEYHEVLDLGCGSALYLTDFCKEVPGITAWGVEPDPGGYAEAVSHVAGEGMSGRIKLANRSATAFLDDPPEECRPDLLVLGYVLQEVLQQEGEEAVEGLLRNVARAFPGISIAVIEVANEIANPTIMRHGLATNFWNAYFLMHVFTAQRLESPDYWERLFARTGWRVDAFVSTDRNIDSTGLELGYLLRAA
ncbi:hypothetical protein [Amycolatopsis sp. cmx-4-61]|uniref:hypothetical protein n=1 Tax=Amycolatopsis sp. cmx-4-61 TaxID=2790937 RepID=UPI00397DFF23